MDVFEGHGYRLACRYTMSDHIPFIHYLFILSQEISLVKEEIANKEVLVIFDGTIQFGEVLAIVLRYVNDNWEPV